MGKSRNNKNRKKVIVLQIAAIAVVLAAIVVAVLFIFVFGGKRKAKQAARTYMKGIANQNVDTVLEVTDTQNEVCTAFANAFTLDDKSVAAFEYKITDCSKASDEDIAEAVKLYYYESGDSFDKAYICEVSCTITSAGTGEEVDTVYELFSYELDGKWYALRLR